MKRKIFTFFTCLFLALSIFCNLSAAAEQQTDPNKYHGSDSFFKANGISIFWAILKGSEESNSWVYIKIINQEENLKQFHVLGLIATDPFSDSEEWIIKGKKLEKENIVKLNRESFKKMMGKTFFFYQSEEIKDYQSQIPDMIVYYLSVPDTAPEFLSLEKLEAYFKDLEKRLEKVESTIKNF